MAKIDAPIQLNTDDAEALGSVLYDALTQADADRQPFIDAMEDNRELINAADEPDENLRWEGACPFNVPLLKIYRNAFLARLSRSLLKTDPIHYFDGRDPLAKQYEGAVEKYHYAQAQRVLDLEYVWRNSVLASTLDDGTGAAYITQETETRRVLRYIESKETIIDPETGEILTATGGYTSEFKPTVIYDGPRVTPIPIEHVGVYPAASRDAQAAQGAYVKLSKSGQDLVDGMLRGKYDKRAVEELQQNPFDAITHATRADLEAKGINLSSSSYNPMRDFQALPFDLVEWYWFYNNPAMPSELQCDWLITQEVNTKAVLRAIPNPWGHGLRPIVFSHVFPPKYGILGDSLADYAGKFQKFLSWMLRAMVDGMNGRIDPELVTGSGITPEMLERWREARGPGKIHDFQSAEDLSKVLHPLVMGMNPNEALPVVQLIQSMADLSVQYQNAFSGRPSSKQITATELETMMQEGQEGVLDMVDSSAKALSEAGRLIKGLNSQFSMRDSVRGLWAIVNPEHAQDDVTAILQAEYDIRAAGTTETSNRAMRKQRAMEAYSVMKDNQIVLSDPTGKSYWQISKDLVVEGIGRRAAEPYIGKEEDAWRIPSAMAANQTLQQAAQLVQAAATLQQAMGEPEGDPMGGGMAPDMAPGMGDAGVMG